MTFVDNWQIYSPLSLKMISTFEKKMINLTRDRLKQDQQQGLTVTCSYVLSVNQYIKFGQWI